jgi:hypothetical protein
LQNDLYLLIGLLIGFIFALTTSLLIIYFDRLKPVRTTTLGDLRKLLSKVQDDIQLTQVRVWDYGVKEEEQSQNWQIACTSIIGQAVSVLQSCWYGRQQYPAMQDIYDELLTGLKSVGLVEIKPSLGQAVKDDDKLFRIKKIEGEAPFTISKLLCPGYCFKLKSSKNSDISENIVIEPALIEVKGNKSS